MGAGGTNGGTGTFFIGFIMFCAGIYLLLNNINVYIPFIGRGGGMLNFGGYQVASGFVLVPLMFGIGYIFYNANSPIGWILSLASMVMLIFGIITSTQFNFSGLSLFDLIIILILLVGGFGSMLSVVRSTKLP